MSHDYRTNPLMIWGVGLLLPIAAIAHAIRVINVGATSISSRTGVRLEFFGSDAVSVAVFYIGAALAMHFFYFDPVAKYPRKVSLGGKCVSFLTMAAGAGALFLL